MSKSFETSLVTKGILITVIISFILTLVLGLVYFFTSIQNSGIHSIIIVGVSVLIASIYTAFRAGSKGLIYGVLIGLGFFLLSLVVYYIFYEGSPSWRILLEKCLVSLITGAIGGTIGAILKR